MSESKSKKPEKAKEMKVKESQGFYDIPERYELIEGVRYDFLSSPKTIHQKILTNLHLGFHQACHMDGEIFLAPLDVHFDEDNIVQPDVIYIANENRAIIRDGFIFGCPDLVVEILSNSTGNRDKTIKKALYERFGVKEYWLADPVYRTVDQFALMDGKYQFISTLSEHETIHSPTIPCLSIDLSTIFPSEDYD